MNLPAKNTKMTMVLMPGMDGTGDLFFGFVAALPKEFRTVVVSYPKEEQLSYEDLEKFVEAACPSTEPYFLVAESFSVPLAIRVAARNPLGLQGVMLCAGFATSPMRGWLRSASISLANTFFKIPLPKFAVRWWLVGWDAPISLLRATKRAVSSVKAEVLAHRLRSVLNCDVRKELSQVSVPVLYMQANQDRIVSSRCLQVIQETRADIRVEALNGPHLLLQRHPETAAQILVEFVADVL